MLPGTDVTKSDASTVMVNTIGDGNIHEIAENDQYLAGLELSRSVKSEPSSGCQEITNVQKEMHYNPSSGVRNIYPVHLYDTSGDKLTRGIKLYKTQDDMNIALFAEKQLQILEMNLSGQERVFLEAINRQRALRCPFIPISKIDVKDRQMWRSALEGNYPGLKFTSLKGSSVRGTKATGVYKHCRYTADLTHYRVEFHCLLLETNENIAKLPAGAYVSELHVATQDQNATPTMHYGGAWERFAAGSAHPLLPGQGTIANSGGYNWQKPASINKAGAAAANSAASAVSKHSAVSALASSGGSSSRGFVAGAGAGIGAADSASVVTNSSSLSSGRSGEGSSIESLASDPGSGSSFVRTAFQGPGALLPRPQFDAETSMGYYGSLGYSAMPSACGLNRVPVPVVGSLAVPRGAVTDMIAVSGGVFAPTAPIAGAGPSVPSGGALSARPVYAAYRFSPAGNYYGKTTVVGDSKAAAPITITPALPAPAAPAAPAGPSATMAVNNSGANTGSKSASAGKKTVQPPRTAVVKEEGGSGKAMVPSKAGPAADQPGQSALTTATDLDFFANALLMLSHPAAASDAAKVDDFAPASPQRKAPRSPRSANKRLARTVTDSPNAKHLGAAQGVASAVPPAWVGQVQYHPYVMAPPVTQDGVSALGKRLAGDMAAPSGSQVSPMVGDDVACGGYGMAVKVEQTGEPATQRNPVVVHRVTPPYWPPADLAYMSATGTVQPPMDVPYLGLGGGGGGSGGAGNAWEARRLVGQAIPQVTPVVKEE